MINQCENCLIDLFSLLQVQIVNHQETIKEKTDAVVKASKALNFMEACLSKNDNEISSLRARIVELEGSLSMQQTMSTKDGTTVGKTIDCSVSPERNVSCSEEVAKENPMIRKLESENDCLKRELTSLQEVVKDLMQQMDHLMNDTDCLEKTDNKIEACYEDLKKQHEELQREFARAKKDLEGTAKNLEVNITQK